MAINDIVLRTTSNPPLTTKGSELTLAELDNNFIQIYQYITAMNAGGAVPAFNMATTYTGAKYVTYGGKIYQHISATPTTGVIPGTNPAKWAEITLGPLVHVPNTDTKLAEGTVNEVDAADLKALVANFVTTLSEATLSGLVSSEDLVPGRIYAVNDVVLNGTIYLTAYSTSHLSPEGVLIIWTPDPGITVPGAHVWAQNLTYAVGVYVAWDGYVYKNITGVNTMLTPPNDGTNWSIISVTPQFYNQQVFKCRVAWNGGTNMTVVELTDLINNNTVDGNVIGINYFKGLPPIAGAWENNYADRLSNVGDLSRNMSSVLDNVFVRSDVLMEVGGRNIIEKNKFQNSVLEVALNSDFTISGNTVVNAHLKWENGGDSGTEFKNNTVMFKKQTLINMRADFGTIDSHLITDNGSTVEDSIDISGNTKLILDANGLPDVYGTIIATSTNATETVDQIKNGARLFPLIIKPAPGLSLTVTLTEVSSAIDHEIIGPVSGFTLIGDNDDYFIAKPVTINGVDVYQVTQYHINL